MNSSPKKSKILKSGFNPDFIVGVWRGGTPVGIAVQEFLDYFGLKKLDDLPPLADLSDWESLRVQLNLPEVEEDFTEATDAPPDVPVLYPELEAEDAGEEELLVSEWPDPVESTGVATLETHDGNDDKDASANG